MATVSIGGTDYTVYQDETEADEYFNGSSDYDTWNAFTSDEKKRALVSSTRLIDRQSWQGEKEGDPQELAFPRTGVVDCSGNAVDASTTLEKVEEASLMLALDIADGTPVQSNATTEDLTQTLKAGSVMITNFRATEGSASRFPLDVMELIGCYFQGAGDAGIAGSLSYGVCGEGFDDDFGFSGGVL